LHKKEGMEKHLFILILFVLAFIALIIFLNKKNHKDKKDLFKKMPGDYPDPKKVESEFDNKD
jgi:preprotein translocase subunit YajC